MGNNYTILCSCGGRITVHEEIEVAICPKCGEDLSKRFVKKWPNEQEYTKSEDIHKDK